MPAAANAAADSATAMATTTEKLGARVLGLLRLNDTHLTIEEQLAQVDIKEVTEDIEKEHQWKEKAKEEAGRRQKEGFRPEEVRKESDKPQTLAGLIFYVLCAGLLGFIIISSLISGLLSHLGTEETLANW